MLACQHNVYALIPSLLFMAIGAALPDFVAGAESASDSVESSRTILVGVGPSNHPPGSHEVQAGGRLLQHCLRNSNVGDLHVSIHYEWPRDKAVRAAADSVVFLGDTFPAERFENSRK